MYITTSFVITLLLPILTFKSLTQILKFNQYLFFLFCHMIKGLIFKFHTISLTEKAYGDDGCLKQAKELSINKVGHGKYIHGAIRFSEKT